MRTDSALVRLLTISAALGLIACGGDSDGDGNADATTGGDVTGPGTDGTTGTDGATTDGGIPQPSRESIYVAWTERPNAGGQPDAQAQLFIATDDCSLDKTDLCDPGTCEPIEVLPTDAASPYCRYRCDLTPDMAHLVYADSNDAQTLRSVPLGADFQPSGEESVVAAGVTAYSIGEGAVAYIAGNTVFYHDLATGSDVELESLQGLGGVYLSPDGSTVLVKRVTSVTGTTMDLVRYAPDGGDGGIVFTFEDALPTGSLLSGNEPVAISPNGQFAAIVTNYRNQTNICATNADCTEPGFTCPVGSVNSRCISQQRTAQIVNLQATDQLGETCAADADCGERHLCDLSAPDSSGQGTCLPGRVAFGYSGQNACSVLRVGEYNGVVGRVMWVNDRQFSAVLSNPCGGQSLEITDLVLVDSANGDIQTLIENPGQPFGGCENSVEQCYEATDCNVEYYNSSPSPGGAWYGLVGDSYTSANNPEAWLYDVRRDERIPLTRSILTDVTNIQVFGR
jgi:hypothetical protein